MSNTPFISSSCLTTFISPHSGRFLDRDLLKEEGMDEGLDVLQSEGAGRGGNKSDILLLLTLVLALLLLAFPLSPLAAGRKAAWVAAHEQTDRPASRTGKPSCLCPRACPLHLLLGLIAYWDNFQYHRSDIKENNQWGWRRKHKIHCEKKLRIEKSWISSWLFKSLTVTHLHWQTPDKWEHNFIFYIECAARKG